MRPDLSDVQVEQLARLLEALAAEPDPPTTVATPTDAAGVHLADSLTALDLPEIREAAALVDIGSGAGFPGLALAAALPHARVDLVEATARKCEVIDRLAAAAGLANARAVPERAEGWARGDGAGAYDLVTARALASLAILVEYAAPLLRDGGTLVAWKGRRDSDEEAGGARAADEVGLQLVRTHAAPPRPGANDRHLYVFAKVAPTPVRFPRRAGMARKRPLG